MIDGVVMPGMHVASDDGTGFTVRRSHANTWWAIFGDHRLVRDDDLQAPERAPSDVITAVETRLAAGSTPRLAGLTVAKVELDVCGAWMTVANAEVARPIVLRRAGWVDVRGHPGEALGGARRYTAADDRIGLGPGDAVVLQRSVLVGTGDGRTATPDDAVLDGLLSVAGRPPDAIVDALQRCLPTSGTHPASGAVAIAVPGELGADPKQRVADATGVALAEVSLPGHPLGDLQPELWLEPPPPPRLARLRLAPDRSSPRAVRQLLDRLLASWRLDGRIDDDNVKLAASELAANAVLHAGTPQAATIRYLGAAVRIEIDDQSPVLPSFREADDRGGRGLPLVDAVSSSWGAHRRPEGKRVWCEVPVRP